MQGVNRSYSGRIAARRISPGGGWVHNLFEVEDPRGRKVVCTDERWYQHVLVDKPFMTKYFDDVRETIVRPDAIVKDAHFNDQEAYYREQQNAPSQYMKVVVLFTSEREGILWTAHPADSSKAGEKLLWKRSSDS